MLNGGVDDSVMDFMRRTIEFVGILCNPCSDIGIWKRIFIEKKKKQFETF